MSSRWNRLRDWFRARDLQLLAALAAIGVLVLVFIGIADEVTEGRTRRFDEAILLAFRAAPDEGQGKVPA